MTLWVHALGAYRAEIGSAWRDQDYLVRNLVRSLKREPFKGSSGFRMGGKEVQIIESDPQPALTL